MDSLDFSHFIMLGAMVIAFGVLIGYGLLREGQIKSLNTRFEGLQLQLRESEALKAQAEQALAVAESRIERLEPLETRLQDEAERRQVAEKQAADLEARVSRIEILENRVELELEQRRKAETELAHLKSEAAERQKAFEDKAADLTKLRGEIEERLKVMAHDVLGESQKRFFAQAQESFSKQAEVNQSGVKTLVEPIRERLDAFKQKIEHIEKERAEHREWYGYQDDERVDETFELRRQHEIDKHQCERHQQKCAGR